MNRAIFIVLCASLLLPWACSKSKPLTPEEALELDKVIRESEWRARRAPYYARIAMFKGKWESSLRKEIQGADRILIRNGDMLEARDPVYFSITDAKEVEDFIGKIVIDEDKSESSCECAGQQAVEFYRGDVLLTRIGSCYGWYFKYRAWPCDGHLKEEFGKYLFEKYFKQLAEERSK